MKKIFISCPMTNRDPESVALTVSKMFEIGKLIIGDSCEMICPYDESFPNNEIRGTNPIERLSKSIELMAKADYVICLDDYFYSNRCNIEHDIAVKYNIPIVKLPAKELAPDISDYMNGIKTFGKEYNFD